MVKNLKKLNFVMALACLTGLPLEAQEGVQEMKDISLPLKRVVLFSSGVGYYEHGASVGGAVRVSLPFNIDAVNDALKSLVINDPGAASPWVSYASEQTLARTLNSLKIDLWGNPGAADILASLRGAEITVQAPNAVTGRIIGVEKRPGSPGGPGGPAPAASEAYLSLFTAQGVRVLALGEISSFSFSDPAINSDLARALDLILASRDGYTRNLLVNLPGSGTRAISLSYVIPSPVWKVSYRLDLRQGEPEIQGWAVVDNDGDTDWENVELSLVTGRPVSFIQNLYPPYYLDRPVVPLAIAGIARARTYEPGWQSGVDQKAIPELEGQVPWAYQDEIVAEESYSYRSSMAKPESAPSAGVNTGVLDTAAGRTAGDQFEFTLKRPVNLPRQQSAMFPLVEGPVKAEKVLIFSGSTALNAGGPVNPALSVELTNNTGMKLPAGPVTVFDGGSYAGDALMEFFPENDKRYISYGDDLSVSGTAESSGSREVTAVTVTGGVMVISRKTIHARTYVFRNASGAARKLMVEHPATPGAELTEPREYLEKTGSLYRFAMDLPAASGLNSVRSDPGSGFRFTVREETPTQERIVLSQLSRNSLAAYISSEEIPPRIKTALQRAAELKTRADDAKNVLANLESEKTRKISDQDRIRRNLEAAGNQTQAGLEYLRRLTAMDTEIDALTRSIETARKTAESAQGEYDAYLASLTLN